MPTVPGHWCQRLSLGAPCGAPKGWVSVSVKGNLLTLSKPKSEALGALGTMAKALNFLESGQVPQVGLIKILTRLNDKTFFLFVKILKHIKNKIKKTHLWIL